MSRMDFTRVISEGGLCGSAGAVGGVMSVNELVGMLSALSEGQLAAFRAYYEADAARAAEETQRLALVGSVVDSSVVSGSAVNTEPESEVSARSSASSARARKRARARARKRAAKAGAGASVLSYTPGVIVKDRLSTLLVGEGVEGFCYLSMFKPEARERQAKFLGLNPSFSSLLQSSRADVVDGWERLMVSKAQSGVYHLASAGMVGLQVCLKSMVIGREHQFFPRTIGGMLAQLCVGVSKVLVDKRPNLDDKLGSWASSAVDVVVKHFRVAGPDLAGMKLIDADSVTSKVKVGVKWLDVFGSSGVLKDGRSYKQGLALVRSGGGELFAVEDHDLRGQVEWACIGTDQGYVKIYLDGRDGFVFDQPRSSLHSSGVWYIMKPGVSLC